MSCFENACGAARRRVEDPPCLWCRAAAAALVFSLALLAGCATAPKATVSLAAVPPAQAARAAENLRIFNATWDLVNRKHFDPKFQGVDWEAAAAPFAPEAVAAPDQKALYAVLNRMVDLLHDSHTHALTPSQAEERHTHVRART